MIYDVFYFNNELDLLEIRLNILDPYVDFFVISEARETFSGIPKPLYYLENKERFAKWNHKIIHHVVDENDGLYKVAMASTNIGAGEHWWVREFVQKESVRYTLERLNDEDIVYISDVDEIWNPNLTFEIKDDVYKLLQDWCYIYYLNQRTSEDNTYFTGTVMTRYKNIKNACINHLRTRGKTEFVEIKDGGWHFNALGGKEKKIEAFKHPVYTHEYMASREKGKYLDESKLPKYLLENKHKYLHLWKTEK